MFIVKKILMTKKKITSEKKNAILVFEDEIFYGYGFGSFGITIGEICFNTSISGYQEILTDPSYKNQIINFTFPHIGIVGTNAFDNESYNIHAAGCIVNNKLTEPSNHRSDLSFNDWLKKNGKICIAGVDTRTITRKIRDNGSVKCLIHYSKSSKFDVDDLKLKLKHSNVMNSLDLASEVSSKDIYEWSNGRKIKVLSKDLHIYKNKNVICVIDFGIKLNILHLLEKIGLKVLVFPISFDYGKIIMLNPLGVFLSNGPGDPSATYKKIKKKLFLILEKSIPVFGICLGHQILALYLGGKTKKMHHGHRGANHPVKNVESNKVEITVQNHGYVVAKNKLPKNINITHYSLFDGTIAGIELNNKPFFSVQYHPEASPGPQDSEYLFQKFKKNIGIYAKKR